MEPTRCSCFPLPTLRGLLILVPGQKKPKGTSAPYVPPSSGSSRRFWPGKQPPYPNQTLLCFFFSGKDFKHLFPLFLSKIKMPLVRFFLPPVASQWCFALPLMCLTCRVPPREQWGKLQERCSICTKAVSGEVYLHGKR